MIALDPFHLRLCRTGRLDVLDSLLCRSVIAPGDVILAGWRVASILAVAAPRPLVPIVERTVITTHER